jgi:hypothetical protein
MGFDVDKIEFPEKKKKYKRVYKKGFKRKYQSVQRL